jgi:hypothetical protein
MAEIKGTLEIVPRLPATDELDSKDLLVRYDDDADILHVHFFGRPLPAVNIDITEYLDLRVDIETHQVVGLQIDGYLHYAVHQNSALLTLAELAGIEPAAIDEARRAISIDRKRTAALRTVLSDLQLAIA